ncbi:MAG: triple tyrosine motif-containing protein, partial [Bacteroidota bacterium]
MPANSIYFRGLLTILCWLMLSSVCSSQTYSLQHAFYTYYTQEDGLGNGVLSDIVQDQTGFIWVGTFNGLFRFDGTEFQAFLHDPSDSTSISHNQIKELSVGPDNRLWIATDGGGLNVFDPSTEQFKSWIIDSGKPGSQPQPRSQTVLVDKKGRVWVGTEDEGFCRLNEAENTFDCFEVVPGKDYPFNVVLAFAEDPQDEDLLWVSNGRYLVQFSHSKEAITWHLPIIDVLDRVDVFDDLFVDSNRTLWVRTYDSGLFQLDIETGKTQVHFPDVPELETRPTFFYIKDIHPKDEEEIWVATHNYGLGTFHKETQQFNFINTDTEGENLFAFNARSLWLDKDNRLWVGYEDRVEVIDPYKQIFRHFSLPGEFHVDPSNVFMCNFNNLNDQIIISGRATTAVLYFKEAFSDYSVKRIIHPNGYPILHNYEVFPYQDDTWLFAERDLPKIGLLTFNPNYPAKDIPARFVEPEEEFRDRISRKMVRDQAGYLWALQYDILKIDLEQDTFIRYPNYLREELGPNWNRSLSSLFIDSRDQLWVGSELGPRVFNTTDFERVAVPSWTDEPLNGNEIYEFAEDHQGRIWMNTAQQGIRIYDPNAKDVDPYTHLRMKDGLPSDQMYNILVDLNGDIWSSTAGGLCRIDSETLRITTFTSQEGLKRNDLGYLWRSAMQQLDNGSICIGNFGGFTWFHPDSIPINHNPPPIVFTGFKVFDRDYQLDKNLNYLDKIELEHQQNFFQFQFAALNYTDPNNNTYQYQLEGYDADWRTSNEGVASYTGVQGGNYTFRVKASNNHGVWNAEGIA